MADKEVVKTGRQIWFAVISQAAKDLYNKERRVREDAKKFLERNKEIPVCAEIIKMFEKSPKALAKKVKEL